MRRRRRRQPMLHNDKESKQVKGGSKREEIGGDEHTTIHSRPWCYKGSACHTPLYTPLHWRSATMKFRAMLARELGKGPRLSRICDNAAMRIQKSWRIHRVLDEISEFPIRCVRDKIRANSISEFDKRFLFDPTGFQHRKLRSVNDSRFTIYEFKSGYPSGCCGRPISGLAYRFRLKYKLGWNFSKRSRIRKRPIAA